MNKRQWETLGWGAMFAMALNVVAFGALTLWINHLIMALPMFATVPQWMVDFQNSLYILVGIIFGLMALAAVSFGYAAGDS